MASDLMSQIVTFEVIPHPRSRSDWLLEAHMGGVVGPLIASFRFHRVRARARAEHRATLLRAPSLRKERTSSKVSMTRRLVWRKFSLDTRENPLSFEPVCC